jgi:hypothetical protein
MDHDEPTEFQPSFPPISRWLRRAIWARFILLGLYVLLSAAWYFAFLSVSDPFDLSIGPKGSVFFVAGTLVVFGMQLLLLLGAPQLHWPRPQRRRSIFVSLAAGAAIAALLSAGIFFAGRSLYQLIYDPASFRSGIVFSASAPTTAPATATMPAPTTAPAAAATPASSDSDVPWTLIGIALLGWTFWFLIFALLGAGHRTKRFSWMYRMLIAGTVIELLITIPVDAEVRKRTSCYCGEGTFLSLIIGLTAILWTFGPGVAILFFVRRNQLKAASDRCLKCGYDLRELESRRCPECGTKFRPALSH